MVVRAAEVEAWAEPGPSKEAAAGCFDEPGVDVACFDGAVEVVGFEGACAVGSVGGVLAAANLDVADMEA